jgi:hypothetical protein
MTIDRSHILPLMTLVVWCAALGWAVSKVLV